MRVSVFIGLFVLVIYLVSKASKSNSAEVEYICIKADSVGSMGGDIPALHMLNVIVEENFLDREYYEATAYETVRGHHLSANYNKKHQALFIGDADGWWYFFYATPTQLKEIVDQKIPAFRFKQFLKPFPEDLLGGIPTRSRSLLPLF